MFVLQKWKPQCDRSRTTWGIENKYFFAKPNFITKLLSKPSPINFVKIDHEIFSMVILLLLLIQEGLLSVTSKSVCTESVSYKQKYVHRVDLCNISSGSSLISKRVASIQNAIFFRQIISKIPIRLFC